MRPPSPWNDEIVATVTDLWKTKSASEIVAEIRDRYGVEFTRNAIVGKLHRLGLTISQKTEFHHMTRSGVTGVRRPRAQKKAEKKERTTILRIISGFKSLRVIKTTTSEVGPLRCAEIEPLHVDMLDLSRDQCHYPYGDGPFTFCGQPAHQGSSYCTAHHFLCWTPARRQQERARAA